MTRIKTCNEVEIPSMYNVFVSILLISYDNYLLYIYIYKLPVRNKQFINKPMYIALCLLELKIPFNITEQATSNTFYIISHATRIKFFYLRKIIQSVLNYHN